MSTFETCEFGSKERQIRELSQQIAADAELLALLKTWWEIDVECRRLKALWNLDGTYGDLFQSMNSAVKKRIRVAERLADACDKRWKAQT